MRDPSMAMEMAESTPIPTPTPTAMAPAPASAPAAPSTTAASTPPETKPPSPSPTPTPPHTDASPPPIHEKALVRKLDLHIIPLVMALYLFSFLDRVNIGNARLYGLEADLDLTPRQFQIALSILFVTYIAFELPSNLVLKKFRPGRYIAGITLGWGVVATLTGVVSGFGGLVAARLALGALEAGLFPGLAVYLTFFYTKRELALRIGYLFVSAALAGACGGLLAYCIGFMDGVAGLRGWRWILILEGIPTALLGIAAYFLLADDPEHAPYLTPAEKAYMRERMLREMGQTEKAMEFHWGDVKKCFLDWRCWAFAIAQFGVDTMLYGFSTFLPTIILSITIPKAYTPPQIQALTIPPYLLGALIYLLTARYSDATQRRALPTLLATCVSISGYTLLLLHPAPPGVKYTGCLLIAAGLYVSVGLPLSWLPSNCPRYGKRAAATGVQLAVGNCAGVLTSFLYGAGEAPGGFVRGHAVTLGMVAVGGGGYAVLWVSYWRANLARERGGEEWRVRGLGEEEVRELGDEAPTFRYTT